MKEAAGPLPTPGLEAKWAEKRGKGGGELILGAVEQGRARRSMDPWVRQLSRENQGAGTAEPEVPALFLHTPFFGCNSASLFPM